MTSQPGEYSPQCEGQIDAFAILRAVVLPDRLCVQESRAQPGGERRRHHRHADRCRDRNIEIRFIQPGKPDQNACIERFNPNYREEVFSAYLFDSLDEVREITAEWLERYNEIGPHGALGSLPAARYREQLLAAEIPV